MSIKLNVNIRTLLNNCEELAKFKVNHVRLQPLVDSLQNMINELQQTDSKYVLLFVNIICIKHKYKT